LLQALPTLLWTTKSDSFLEQRWDQQSLDYNRGSNVTLRSFRTCTTSSLGDEICEGMQCVSQSMPPLNITLDEFPERQTTGAPCSSDEAAGVWIQSSTMHRRHAGGRLHASRLSQLRGGARQRGERGARGRRRRNSGARERQQAQPRQHGALQAVKARPLSQRGACRSCVLAQPRRTCRALLNSNNSVRSSAAPAASRASLRCARHGSRRACVSALEHAAATGHLRTVAMVGVGGSLWV
jgi:hypothetical protein